MTAGMTGMQPTALDDSDNPWSEARWGKVKEYIESELGQIRTTSRRSDDGPFEYFMIDPITGLKVNLPLPPTPDPEDHR